ncbi:MULTISPECIES: TetR/AcrR family transcriptional regulator [Nocardia]|uniref:TetR family transcriptional regulator n=1 Tax=Nocardia arthritidis TaxID=228602 RepID=A0A6G9YUH8_9NOCA|nr:MULTISPECIES: TetR/AcrR family transcriptional regulator [Nocardia]QIS16777.1 TetR family transcriptional regulator [Nocardia arthritidis]
MDRRVHRTRSVLHRALIELMLERGYDRITVRDILARADVGRSTFYAHFRDKDDLLLVSSTEYLRAAVAAARSERASAEPLAPIATLFRLAAEHPEVYRALLGRKSSGVLLRATQRMVAEILTEQLTGRLGLDEAELASTITFLAWGVVGLLGAIAEADPPITADQAYERFVQLVGPGLIAEVA